MGKPAWFNPGTYLWTPYMGHDFGGWSPAMQANVQQQWWRDPGWGGHVIWNPNWGFQDLESVQNFYKNWDPTATPKFHQAFKAAGFTKQLSDAGNWSQFYGDRPVVQNQPKYGQSFQQGQFTWGQPQTQTTTTTAEKEAEETSTGFYAPKYGSTLSQYLPRQSGGQRYGTGEQYKSPARGRYYGTNQKRNTSMRYGYKPSM